MSKSIRHIILGICFIFFSCYSAKAALKDAREFYLDNGMQVVVIPNHKAPIIYHAVVYHSGSVDEPVGKGGLAHLTEHLMFRGTHKFKDGRFNQLIENNGGQSNAGTTHDFTYYYQFLNIKSLELAMYLEANRMTDLSFENDAFLRERQIVFQERQQRMNSDPASGFWEKFDKFYFGDNPYGHPVAGTEAEILALTKEDVISFYQKHYVPNNATLILAGDIDIKTAKKLAQKYYGDIDSHPTIKRHKLTIENLSEYQKNPFLIKSQLENVAISRMLGQYMLPHYMGNEKELYALLLYADWLGEGVNSLLYQDLVDKNKIAVSVGADLSYLSRGNSQFYIYAYFNKPENEEKIKQTITKILNDSEKILTEKKLQELKEKMLAGQIYQDDNPAHAANIVIRWLSAGFELSELQNFEANLNQISLEDIRRAIRNLRENEPTWGIVSPKGMKHEN